MCSRLEAFNKKVPRVVAVTPQVGLAEKQAPVAKSATGIATGQCRYTATTRAGDRRRRTFLVTGKVAQGAADAAAKLTGISKFLLTKNGDLANDLAEPLVALIVSMAGSRSCRPPARRARTCCRALQSNPGFFLWRLCFQSSDGELASIVSSLF
jgi:hypothetical protein